MSFTLPDLVIEGAIRKGFDFLRNNAGKDASSNIFQTDLIDSGRVFSTTLFSPLPPNTPESPITLGIIFDGFQPVEGTPGRFVRLSDGQRIQFNIGDALTVQAFLQATGGPSTSIRDTALGTNVHIISIVSSVAVSSTRSIFTITILNVAGNTNGWSGFLNTAGGTAILKMDGTLINEEVFGAGGEVLNMLFNFRTKGD